MASCFELLPFGLEGPRFESHRWPTRGEERERKAKGVRKKLASCRREEQEAIGWSFLPSFTPQRKLVEAEVPLG
ncbi:hypothetical protein GN956_G20416 [Arapaima gigas]